MWEVDPETKSKLLALQKIPPNAICADCPAPAPQWASPKFGAFICLECAGQHRGLGVHISFVRSIMMDSFKKGEVRRMEVGGNQRWRAFWDGHAAGGAGDATVWSRTSVADRYGGVAGEEWKERLSAEVEGREYVPVVRPATATALAANKVDAASRIEGRGSAPGSRSGTPAGGDKGAGRKEKNEAYFAKLGNENAARPTDLPPNQGGKYAGFGSGWASTEAKGTAEKMPGVDDFQKDPVAALSKGLGWFAATVGKSAKSVNEGWIQPGVQKLAEADLATQARQTAAQVAANAQKAGKGAAEQFNRFVEGDRADGTSKSSVEPEKKDFWDTFGAPAAAEKGESASSATAKRGALGTAAVKSRGGDEGWEKF